MVEEQKSGQISLRNSRIQQDYKEEDHPQIYTQPQFTENQQKIFQSFIKQNQSKGMNDAGSMLKSLYQPPPPDKEKQQGPDTKPQPSQGGIPGLSHLDIFQQHLQQSNHPMACIFHILFKGVALFTYLFLAIFMTGVTADELVIVLCAFDFWTVKNVTGRLLVGLRWWSEPRTDGSDDWVFECKVNEKLNNPFNEKVFWGFQAIFTLVWVVFCFINVLSISLTNVCVCAFAITTNGVNLWAYYKCSKTQKEKVKEFATKMGTDFAIDMLNTSLKMPLGLS